MIVICHLKKYYAQNIISLIQSSQIILYQFETAFICV